jgi:hypothetical protein
MEARDQVDELIEQITEASRNLGIEIIQEFELEKRNPVLAESV